VRSDGCTTKAAAAAAAAADVCFTDSSLSDDDDDDAAEGFNCLPTTFQQRVASAKLTAGGSRRSTPATTSSPASRLSRVSLRQQDSLTTLDPDKLANLLGSKTKLCSIIPGAFSSDGEDMMNKDRTTTKVKHRSHKTTTPPSSDDEQRRLTKDKEKKSKRKPKLEKTDRTMSPADEDTDKTKVNGVKREKDERHGGHRKTKKDAAGEQSKTMKKHGHRDKVDPLALPSFNLGEYPAPTVMSPRLDAVKKSVERAHKNRRQADHKTKKQAGAQRGRSKQQEIGTRKTLQSDALLVGKTQFVKLKVDVT